jgi:hypothetical protein
MRGQLSLDERGRRLSVGCRVVSVGGAGGGLARERREKRQSEKK